LKYKFIRLPFFVRVNFVLALQELRLVYLIFVNVKTMTEVDVRTKNDNSGQHCGNPRQVIKFDSMVMTSAGTKTSQRPSCIKIYKYCDNEFTPTFISMKNITTILILFEMVASLSLKSI
jgi:hypothetical protein